MTTAAAVRSPLLDRPGAVAADGPDAGVAAHYGDPFREQRTLATAAGVVDRSHRGVLRVTGADRLSWLHSLTSQHLERLPAGRGTQALVLSPHGHVEHHLAVADDGTATWLRVEPGTVPVLLEFLDRMRFLLRVDPRDVSAEVAELGLVGPAVPDVLRGAGLPVPAAEDDVVTSADGVLLHRVALGVDVLVPRERLTDVWDLLVAAGARAVGVGAYEALRVESRLPRLGFETDHRTIPHEVGWLATAVHLEKGCYRGQETVARVHNLGRPPRRLVLLHLDGSDEQLPAHGDDVTWQGARVGFVTTAARHHELGPVALALVKRTTPDDAELVAGAVAAAVVAPD